MSENQKEQQVPSKEEVIKFLQEQIEMKEVQLKLQELNTKLAVNKAEELKALSFIGQITNPQPPANSSPYVLTQEDIDENPELVEQGFKAGDEVMKVNSPEASQETQPKKTLKKTK